MVAKVIAWRDSRKSTPRAADIGVTVLRALLEFGRLRSIVIFNAAENIPKIYRGGDRAEIIWTDDDMNAFLAKAVELGMGHVADGLRLAALTGLRREYLVTLKWSQVTDVAITKKAHKRSQGKRLFARMPRIPALDEELKGRHRADGVETVLVNKHGRPWTGDGFTGRFNA
jgi:integrase